MKPKKTKTLSQAVKRFASSRVGKASLMVAVMIGSALLAAVVRAYNHATLTAADPSRPTGSVSFPQVGGAPARGQLHSRLSLQPEANRMRRRLGKRFLRSGGERETLVGALTISGQQNQVRIVRTQDSAGERVEIAVGAGPAALTWTAAEGARAWGSPAAVSQRLLIERLVLDSADQFVLAQLRGSSYFIVAQRAMPQGVASEDYNGPVWDIVRVAERVGSEDPKSESPYRLYYINCETGLIEKVFSNEHGQSVVAELSGWTQVDGEWVAARTTWRINGQALMELSLTGVTHGPRL